MVDFSNVKEIEIPEGKVKSISSNGTILWQLKGGLPDEYQQVEWIQSNGSQYIDTGINGNGLGSFKIVFDTLGSVAHSYEMYFAGDMNTSNTTEKLFANGNYLVLSDNRLGNLNIGYFDISVSNNGIYVNNEYKYSYTEKEWGTLTFWVFNSHSETNLGSSMKLYSLKMYSDSVLVRDFIPCYRKSDNVIGLYDLVSSTFFTNQGIGTFTKGGDL